MSVEPLNSAIEPTQHSFDLQICCLATTTGKLNGPIGDSFRYLHQGHGDTLPNR